MTREVSATLSTGSSSSSQSRSLSSSQFQGISGNNAKKGDRAEDRWSKKRGVAKSLDGLSLSHGKDETESQSTRKGRVASVEEGAEQETAKTNITCPFLSPWVYHVCANSSVFTSLCFCCSFFCFFWMWFLLLVREFFQLCPFRQSF